MTTPKDQDPNTTVPQDEANESDADGRVRKSEPTTTVPRDEPEPNTTVPRDNS